MNTSQKDEKKKNKGMQGLGQVMVDYDWDFGGKNKRRYISREFQDFGYRMALELNDLKNVSLYMRLAKTVDRSILEACLSFVKDANNVKSKSRLFLWKMKQIKQGKEPDVKKKKEK